MFDFFNQSTPLQSLHAYLSTKDIPGFQDNVKCISANKGKIIYDVSQQYTDIYEIESGVVKLGGRSHKDEDYIYELVTQGEIFGNISFLNKPFREYCKVVIPARMYAFNRDFFVYHVLHDHIATEIFIKQIIYRWHKTESILSAIRQFDPRERVNRLFENLNFPIEIEDKRKVVLNKNLTYKDIADLTGTTRQLVAEILR